MPEHSEVELLGRNWDSEKLSDLYNMLHWIRVTYVCVCVCVKSKRSTISSQKALKMVQK